MRSELNATDHSTLSPTLHVLMHLLCLPLRNLRSRILRTLLTLSGILIGVAVILAIAIVNESTLASVESVFNEASGKAQLVVNAASAADAGFDANALEKIRKLDEIAYAIPSLDQQTLRAQDVETWQVEFGVSGNLAQGNNLHVLGIEPDLDTKARTYKITQGRFITAKDNRAAVLVEDYAREHELKLGQELRVLTRNGDVAFEIVGMIAKEGPGRINDGGTAFVPLETVQDIFERGGELTQIDVVVREKFAQDQNAVERIRKTLETKLGKNFSVVYPATRGQVVTQLLSTYRTGLGFGSTIALFVGAFLIYNTFAMTVLERTREIGMLRALGMTRAQILALILQEAMLLGILGSALGLGAGVLLARGLVVSMTEVIGTQISEIVVPPSGIVSALIVGLVVTFFAALLPAWSATNISPIEALRVRARSEQRGWIVRRGWLLGMALVIFALLNVFVIPFRENVGSNIAQISIFILLSGAALLVPAVIPFFQRALTPILTALFGNEGALGAGNLSRAPGRTALTVGALMIGLAMVIGQGAMSVSFSKNLLDWVETALGADLYVRSPVGMNDEMARRLKTIQGVQEVTPVTYLPVKLGERLRDASTGSAGNVEQLIYIAIDPATYTRVANFQFSGDTDADAALARLAQNDAVFIATTVADKYHLRVGQTIPLVTPRGSSSDGHEFLIAGLIVDFTGQGFTVTGSRADLKKYFGVSEVNNYLVRLTPQVKSCHDADCRREEDVRNEIEMKFKSRHLQTESSSSFRARIMDLSNQAFSLLNILTLIGVIVAALGVINTLTMNVLERTREIGGLRALGLTMRQTAKMILAEALLVGIIGGAFGLLFGYVLSHVFLRGINELGGYRVSYIFPLNAFVSGIVIALVLSQLAALYPAWRAARVGIVEAIQHE